MEPQTGDILLFRGDNNSAIDKLIMDVTNSVYSHCAIVVKDPWWGDLNKGLYIIQADMNPIESVESNIDVRGVSLSLLQDSIQGCNVDIRRISNVKYNSQFFKSFEKIHSVVHNLPYDSSIIDWIKVGLSNFGFSCFNNRHTNNFWCSALVGYFYTQLKWLPSKTNWSNMTPQDIATCQTVFPIVLSDIEIFHMK